MQTRSDKSSAAIVQEPPDDMIDVMIAEVLPYIEIPPENDEESVEIDVISDNQQVSKGDTLIVADKALVNCHLKSKCKNEGQKPVVCDHCSHTIHITCAAGIRRIFHSAARKEKEKELSFDVTDVICSKACYNKMVKAKIQVVEQNIVLSSAKVTRFWHNYGPTDSINSLLVLMTWLTTEGNYLRWRGGDNYCGMTKKSLASSIVNLIHDQVGVERKQKHVINKISTIESDYRNASDWLGATGSGVECQISVREYVMKLCPFFYDLQEVMEDRASTKPLFSVGCELEQEDNHVSEEESRREKPSFTDVIDKLSFSDDDDDYNNDNSDASTLRSDQKKLEVRYQMVSSTSSEMECSSVKKRIKGVAISRRSNALSNGEENEKEMINLKRKQLDEETESRKVSFMFRQSEVESTVKLQTAQAEKVNAEARTARIIAKVTIMRERKKLLLDGFTQAEVDEALPLDME